MYKCKHFKAYELVPPELHADYTENEIWGMFDRDALRALDWLRDTFGQITVNDWFWGGGYSQSGIRTPSSRYYSRTSMHSSGRAFDCKFKNYKAEEVRKKLKEMETNEEYIPKGIRRIENKVSWFHFDSKFTGLDKIYWFNP